MYTKDESTYIAIWCDGYVIRFHHGDQNVSGRLFDIYDGDNTTLLASVWPFASDGTNHLLGYDTTRSVVLLEDTPIRAVVRVKGNFQTSGQVDMTNSTSITAFFVFYPDRYDTHFEWVVGGSISLDTSARNIFVQDIEEGTVTSRTGIYESSGSEGTDSGETNYDTADYIGQDSDEITFHTIVKDKHSQSGFQQRVHDLYGIIFGWYNVTLSADTYWFYLTTIVDSADRTGGQQYNSTDRLAYGDDIKDSILDQSPTNGDDVTNMILPARVLSGTLHSFGGHHYSPNATPSVKLTADITRMRPPFVIHDWPVKIGALASLTDILEALWHYDDNAANIDVLDELGDSNWDGDASANTDTLSVTDALRGRALQLDAGSSERVRWVNANAPPSPTNWQNHFSILIVAKPTFAYDVATAGEVLVGVGNDTDGNNSVKINYDSGGSDLLQLRAIIGGTDVSINGPSFTDDYSLQRFIVFMIMVDLENDLIAFFIDGKTIGFAQHTGAWGYDIDEINVGSDVFTDYGSFIVEKKMLFNQSVIPLGGFFIGNGEGYLADIKNPHAQLSFFWDAQSTAAKGGSNLGTDKTGTLGSGNTGGSTSFPTSGGILGGYFDNEARGTTYGIGFPVSGTDVIDGDQGVIALWLKFNQVVAGDWFFGYGDSNNYISLRLVTGVYVAAEIWLNNTDQFYNNTSWTPTASLWYWIVLRWNIARNRLDLHIGGVPYIGTDTTAESWGYAGGGNIYLGCSESSYSSSADVVIGRAFIGKDPDIPEIWTSFGKPINDVIIKKNGVIQQRGGTNGYDIVTLPNYDKLIVTADELVGA